VKITVCIASYGEERWKHLAESRALPSVQGAAEVLIGHEPDGTISSARNGLAERAMGDYLCFLDADDELGPGYVEAMQRALERESREGSVVGADGTPLLLTPAVSQVNQGRRRLPFFFTEVPLEHGNWLVIGTLVQREQFFAVGGFDTEPHAYEDWSLFARCWKAGARIVKVPEAVYVAHVTRGSRNRSLNREQRVRTHYAVGRKIFPDLYDENWLRTHLRNARVRV
jgi:GT2 family glycosyltransferase